MSRKEKVVHILAKGSGWDEINDVPEGEIIYGCNDSFLRTPQVTHTFHMHILDDYLKQEKTHSSTKLCIEHANDNPEMEFFSCGDFTKHIPHAKDYPLEEIVDYFGVCYFTSSIEYMIAYALWKEQPTELRYYGVNMTVKQEYMDQKPGVEFWTGIALGRGVHVRLQHQHTSILKTRDGLLYGYLINQYKAKV